MTPGLNGTLTTWGAKPAAVTVSLISLVRGSLLVWIRYRPGPVIVTPAAGAGAVGRVVRRRRTSDTAPSSTRTSAPITGIPSPLLTCRFTVSGCEAGSGVLNTSPG